MGTLSIRLPDSIHNHIKEISEKEHVSINQFISTAVSEKISAILTENYLMNRAKKAKSGEFKKILSKVPKRPALRGDEL